MNINLPPLPLATTNPIKDKNDNSQSSSILTLTSVDPSIVCTHCNYLRNQTIIILATHNYSQR